MMEYTERLIKDPRPELTNKAPCPDCGNKPLVYCGESGKPTGDRYLCLNCYQVWLELYTDDKGEKEAIKYLKDWQMQNEVTQKCSGGGV